MENEHQCQKEDVDWEARPSLNDSDDDYIVWKGRCGVCKRKVYETYRQCPELLDYKTGEELS